MRSSRSAQFWLVVLLVLAGAIAGGALFTKYQLEGLRGRILENAELRTGTQIQVKSVAAFGLRGLRAEGVELSRRLASGTEINLKVPLVYVYVDLTNLLYGQLVIDRVQVEDAEVIVRRPEPVAEALASGVSPASPPSLDRLRAPLPPLSFRVMGSRCRVHVENAVGHAPLDFTNINFDVAKLSDSPALSGTVEASYADDPAKHIKATGRFVGLDDFEARADCASIAAADINVFLPASKQFVLQGSAKPSLRVEGRPDGTIGLTLETSIADLLVRSQPEFLKPITGELDARAIYDPEKALLTVGIAQAASDVVNGTVTGTVQFSKAAPEFNLKLISSQLPLQDILSYAIQDRLERFGKLNYTVSPDAELSLVLSGTAEAPSFQVHAAMSGAEAAFTPEDSRFPSGSLQLGRVDANWDSATKLVSGTIAVTNGTVTKNDLALTATAITANVALDGHKVQITSLNATANAQPIVASGWYDLDEKKGELTAAGVLAEIGKTKLAQSIRNTELDGSLSVNATGRLANGVYTFEGDIDASQTQIGYRWYFLKPPGTGATAHVTGNFTPKKNAKFDINGLVAGTELKANAQLAFNGKKWQLRTIHADSDKLDVVSVGKCLPLPYVITGGFGHAGKYDWKRVDGKTGEDWTATVVLTVDDIAVRAEGSEAPIACKDLAFTGEFVEGEKPQANLTLHAKDAVTPSLRSGKWFVPIERDLTKYPPSPRDYSFALSADSLQVPPWKGTQFTGHAYWTENETGLDKYSAKVDDGTIDGSYRSNRVDNSYTTTAKWTNVPASYFLEHLRQQQVFSGNMDGEVTYAIDRDDPRSVTGSGHFDMANGQFSADYLIALFERQLAGEVSALPPSLRFSKLHTDIEFAGDVVKTPIIRLESDAMKLDAGGEFVIDGDMNYNIKVAVSPEAAERIPLLRDNFNVQGHRIAQQDIDLAFNLAGPTLKPVSTVSETPPVHVTLVSGALETAREALQVIDAPRKILVDLLKIGGGIVGVRKPPQNGNRN